VERRGRAGAGAQLARQPFVTTDTAGAGTRQFTVTSSAAISPHDTASRLACTTACVIVVTLGVGYADATAPIAFALR